MHAIIMVADKMEDAERIFDRKMGYYCPCVKNASVNQAKYLIKYLRKTLKFEKNQISFLRSSRFEFGNSLLAMLEQIIIGHRDEDILFYYSGHGSYHGWGFNNYVFEHINYSDFQTALHFFKGRMILINECCMALKIEPYLSPIAGRYLLFGLSRKNNFGNSNTSILPSVLKAWLTRKRAFPWVLYTEKSRNDKRPVDICADEKLGYVGSCPCFHDFYIKSKEYFLRKPSLRRGVSLDYLMFPKAPE